MRKVVFGINMSADGFCGHEGMIADAELHDYFTEMLSDASDMFLGRKTFELMVPYWPDIAKSQSADNSSNAFARAFNSLNLTVVSKTLSEVRDTCIVRGDIVEELVKLKEQPGSDICVGGLSVASQLSAHGLIDEYHFVIHPVLSGSGPRLFQTESLQSCSSLALMESKPLHSGVIALRYTSL